MKNQWKRIISGTFFLVVLAVAVNVFREEEAGRESPHFHESSPPDLPRPPLPPTVNEDVAISGVGASTGAPEPTPESNAVAPDTESPATLVDWLRAVKEADESMTESQMHLGRLLAERHREDVSRLIVEDPHAALQRALSPRYFELLPPEIKETVPRPVYGVGMYAVVAVCNHDPDAEHGGQCEIHRDAVFGFATPELRVYSASVYGDRVERMTEMDASLYGVVLDNRMALHAWDAVIVDDGPGIFARRYAVYFRGKEYLFDDAASAEEAADQFRDNAAPGGNPIP